MKSVNTIPEISKSLIIDQILKDSGQFDLSPVDFNELDDLLKVVSYDFDFNEFDLKGKAGEQLELRGILDLKEKSIYLDENEKLQTRKRFSHAHEIGHYLMPSHREYFYHCSNSDMKHSTLNILEREANQFASVLLFKGSLFHDHIEDYEKITFNSVARIAEIFGASFVASLRKVISETSKPAAMVIISENEGNGKIDYTIGSQSMREKYFNEVSNIPSLSDLISSSRTSTRNDPHRLKLKSLSANGERVILNCQFYYNGYQHVGLICPQQKGV